MARFLRDIRISNITVTERLLGLIHALLVERCQAANAAIESQNSTSEQKAEQKLVLAYVIRFDNRGYKLYDANEALRYYKQASEVERIIFTLDSAQSQRTNRSCGAFFEIRIDENDPNNCYIQAASDDGDAVDAVYNGLVEIIAKGKNKNGWIRNTWSQLLVQVFGVAMGFTLSLIAALKTSPYLKIENAFVLTFLFGFLIFSNAWGFINGQIIRVLGYAFPNVRFIRDEKSTVHWIVQGLVVGMLVALFLLIFSEAMAWIGKILSEHVAR